MFVIRKTYVFIENLFHGMAVYSGIALVGRLEGKLAIALNIIDDVINNCDLANSGIGLTALVCSWL